jgi:hypothetical protein
MKNRILIAAIALLAIAAIGGGYYCYLNQTKAAYVVIVDITDDLKSNIDTSEVPQHIANTSYEWSETNMRFSTFSNFQNNKVITITIPAQFPLFGNPAKRKKQLQVSYKTVLDTLNHIVASDLGRPQSVIYVPMAQELNRLAAQPEHIKEAFLYTDAQENTDEFSMYRDTDVEKVKSDPERVKALFEKQVPLNSLKGVTVYLIYNPLTPFAESQFLLMANLWAAMFRAHGATVIIGPNLITN